MEAGRAPRVLIGQEVGPGELRAVIDLVVVAAAKRGGPAFSEPYNGC